jgi:hypothetical protein
LRRHLAGLAPKKRASLILAYADGCTHREIAAQLGVPIWHGKGLDSSQPDRVAGRFESDACSEVLNAT